jgi:DNA repair exonuclease SbcCD ATPase subunit
MGEPVKQETTKQLTKLQHGEIEELRNSLRYAEFILARTRQEKLDLEHEI